MLIYILCFQLLSLLWWEQDLPQVSRRKHCLHLQIYPPIEAREANIRTHLQMAPPLWRTQMFKIQKMGSKLHLTGSIVEDNSQVYLRISLKFPAWYTPTCRLGSTELPREPLGALSLGCPCSLHRDCSLLPRGSRAIKMPKWVPFASAAFIFSRLHWFMQQSFFSSFFPWPPLPLFYVFFQQEPLSVSW